MVSRTAEAYARLGGRRITNNDIIDLNLRQAAFRHRSATHEWRWRRQRAATAVARSARARKPASFSSGVRARVLRDMVETSWPDACRLRAPTVASSLRTFTKGSNEYQRMAFSWVIRRMWSSGTAFSANTAANSSGALGHIESLWG